MMFTVIVPVYKDWFRLQKCMIALQAQTLSSIHFKIIIVNNGPKQDVPQELSIPDNAQLHHEPNAASYNARNRGADSASGTYLVFTDPDCIPDSEWLKRADELLKSSKADMIGGRIDIFRAEKGSRISFIYEKHTAFRQEENVLGGKSDTANLIVKKSVFEDMNGFHGDFKTRGDWEFTSRCMEAGYTMAYGDSVTENHPAKKSVRHIFIKQKRLICWGFIQAREKFGDHTLRVLASHLVTGLNNNRGTIENLNDRVVVNSLDLLIYLYRIYILLLIIFKMINPRLVRS